MPKITNFFPNWTPEANYIISQEAFPEGPGVQSTESVSSRQVNKLCCSQIAKTQDYTYNKSNSNIFLSLPTQVLRDNNTEMPQRGYFSFREAPMDPR